jgi:hypothetical protein
MASSQLDVETFLLLEGALIGALVIARIVVVRSVDLDAFPSIIRPRILLGNRLTPAFAVLAAVLLASGMVLRLAGG